MAADPHGSIIPLLFAAEYDIITKQRHQVLQSLGGILVQAVCSAGGRGIFAARAAVCGERAAGGLPDDRADKPPD